jgi:hypothetical protein
MNFRERRKGEGRRIPLPRTPVNKAPIDAPDPLGWHHSLVSGAPSRAGAGISADMVRWGGLAGVAAGVMFGLSGILTFIVAPPQRVLGSFSYYLLEVVIVLAFALTLVAIAGLHAVQSQSGRYGSLGAAGSLLTFLGYVILLVTVHLTTLAGGVPIYSVRLVSGFVALVGSMLLGAMTLYARVLPWWCGVLLIVGFPLGDFLDNVAKGSENIVFAIVWGLVGYALLSRRGTVAEQPSRVS